MRRATPKTTLTLSCLLLACLTVGEAGIRPNIRIKEFRSYHNLPAYGTPRSIQDAGYYWAVYQPHLYRYTNQPNSPLNDLDYGPTWVAKRRYFHHSNPALHYSYDLLTPDSQALLVGRAHGVFWWNGNPPPAIEYYWADRHVPEWFVKKGYDLFYPLEDKQWWARSSAGKWDLISDGKLAQEAGPGPKIEMPRTIFTWNTR